jgi:hypothetical protein
MKISRHDKMLMFEQEFTALVLAIILSFVFYYLKTEMLLYIITLLVGFVLYFWMIYEENVHKTGKKHSYFEYTSSYIMLGQAGLSLGLLSWHLQISFLIVIFLWISIIMYSVGLSRMILYKAVFPK